MSRFIESIRVENRRMCHIQWHNQRYNATRIHFWGAGDLLNLENQIRLPEDLDDGVYKCRVVYDQNRLEVDFSPYTPRSIQRLKLIHANDLDYSFKYEDRSALNGLMEQKGQADDILVVKNGCLTDTSFSNIALFDGCKWVTPDTCLLNGTARQRLLKEGVLEMSRIHVEDVPRYKEVRLINAMLDFDTAPAVQIIL